MEKTWQQYNVSDNDRDKTDTKIPLNRCISFLDNIANK